MVTIDEKKIPWQEGLTVATLLAQMRTVTSMPW
jgi:sulfur carrier protein ThiS